MGRIRNYVLAAVGLMSMAGPVTMGISPVAAQAAPPQEDGHREVVLEPTGDTYRVVSQTVRRSDLPAQENSVRQGVEVRAKGPGGNTVTSVDVADPSEVVYDFVQPGIRGELRGGRADQRPSKLVVQLPLDVEITELEVTGDTIVLAPLADTTPAPAPPTTTIQNNGPASDRVDVVVVGDGFTSAQLGTYQSKVTEAMSYMFSQAPFSEYKSFFNVHRVDLASNQSGVDDTCQGTYVDTALDTGFMTTGEDCRLLWTYSADKVAAAVAGAPQADMVVILANSTVYGGAGGYDQYGVFSINSDMGELLLHEVGHSFGRLADEYVSYSGAYPYGEPWQLNVTKATTRTNIKWEPWINPATAVPTTDTTKIGLFAGADYYPTGVYRPTFNSKMRQLYRPFEQVNHQLLVDRFFDYIPDDTSPPTGSATVSTADTVSLSFSDAQSYIHAYEISAFADFRDAGKVLASNAPTFTGSVSFSTAGTVYVRVTNGEGLTYTTNTAGTLTTPSAPTSFGLTKDYNAKSVNVTWQPPTYNGGSSITGYRVTRSGGGMPVLVRNLSASTRSSNFTGLTDGQTFTFKVEALNAQGYGTPVEGSVKMAPK